jgi:hypothetical protein
MHEEITSASPLRRSLRAILSLRRGRAVESAAVAVFLLAMGTQWWRQRLDGPLLLLAVMAFLVLAVHGGWWQLRRRSVLLLGANAGLILAYVWSLDDTVHVVISVTRTQYRAEIGHDVSIVNRPRTAGNRLALYSGSPWDYHVTPLGEVDWETGGWLLSDAGTAIRFATLGPAWSNLHVVTARRVTDLLSGPIYTLSGSHSWNARGELENGLNANTQIGRAPHPPYTIVADLHRGDGTQGIVLDMNGANKGRLLAVRLDDPDMQWFTYANGVAGDSLGGTLIHPDVLPTIQRDLRLLLGNVVAALMVLLLAMMAYLALLAVFERLGDADAGEVERLVAGLRERRRSWTVVGIASLLVLLFGAWLSTDVLQRIPHVQDSIADLFQARIFALGRLTVPAPRYPQFFQFQFIVIHGTQWFGKYAPGWSLLLAVGVLLHAAWLVNPLLGAVNVILVAVLARRLYGTVTGVVSAVLVASSPFFLFLTGEYMAHGVTLTYLLGASVSLTTATTRDTAGRHSTGLLVATGLLMGMAGMTRQFDALAWVLPFAVYLGVRRGRRAVRDLPAIALGLAVPLAFLLVYDWRLTGDPWTQPYSLWAGNDRPGFGPGFGPLGHTVGEGLWNLGLNLQSLLADLFGWPFYLTLALAALPFLLGRARREDVLAVSIVGLVAVLYVSYWGNGVMYGPRYYYTMVPWIAMLTVRGVQELYDLLLRLPTARHDRLAAGTVVGLLVALLMTYEGSVYLPPQFDLYHGYNYASATELHVVDRAHLHHALVFVQTRPAYAWWQYGVAFSANSPTLDGNVVYAQDLGRADRVLAAAYPGRATYRLRGKTLIRFTPE